MQCNTILLRQVFQWYTVVYTAAILLIYNIYTFTFEWLHSNLDSKNCAALVGLPIHIYTYLFKLTSKNCGKLVLPIVTQNRQRNNILDLTYFRFSIFCCPEERTLSTQSVCHITR